MNRTLIGRYIQATNGDYSSVWMDDSGMPGAQRQSHYLTPDHAIWVAVIMKRDVVRSLVGEFYELWRVALEKTGASELHFNDIYMGRREFKAISTDTRMNILWQTGELLIRYKVPIVVSAMDSQRVAHWRRFFGISKERLGPFDITSPRDCALLDLTMEVASVLTSLKHAQRDSAICIADAGIIKPNMSVRLPGAIWNAFRDNQVAFADSKLVLPLQLADFAAFAVARNQWIMHKPDRKEEENDLIFLLSNVLQYAHNVQHSPPIPMLDGKFLPPQKFFQVTFDDRIDTEALAPEQQKLNEKETRREVARMWRWAAIGCVRNYVSLLRAVHTFLFKSIVACIRHTPIPDLPFWLNGTIARVLKFASMGEHGFMIRGLNGRPLAIVNIDEVVVFTYDDITVPELQSIKVFEEYLAKQGAPQPRRQVGPPTVEK